ncbi:hypothetical protein [Chryseobacterium ginsenosidimutans]|uniref:hypothetical protein n=1 Tax=Chryseobacterium ginsenosidimutans TaxID=687846 RepID=UPI0027BA1A69|nr:hypothetical protein [Chryseobacterium ginsenosidimutans]
MKKNNTIDWIEFIIQITEDHRLNVWHIALIISILKIAYIQNEEKVIRVSRTKLMDHSHIKTRPTYHKYFKELQDFGYIKYTPSYHPDYRSTLEFLNPKIPHQKFVKRQNKQ